MFRKTISAAAAGLAVLAATLTAPAAAFASESGGTKQVRLRSGLTLTIPKSWKVAKDDKDWVRVITGSCPTYGTEDFGFRDWGCHSFWVLGPKALKIGLRTFQAYKSKYGYDPATDVSICPKSYKLYKGEWKLADKGLRQVGPGHKADYHKWAATCVDKKWRVKLHYNQREWYLPTSKILVLDQWDHPQLGAILKNATWN
ncbi:hypothetical protein [Microbispora catharanthi]|uniref:Secreted protein n=1 Tax=Microbispora catharanthi TaxID=1712871 RepID=A0A5N6BKG0_9ACTN|nr:hypothetical protein [Microbispora catharanthi]KAB8180720.1 hypothetical protein FH610_031060 [Microbispora catharanthi]